MNLIAEITVTLFFLFCIPLVFIAFLWILVHVLQGIAILVIDYTAYRWLRKGLRNEGR